MRAGSEPAWLEAVTFTGAEAILPRSTKSICLFSRSLFSPNLGGPPHEPGSAGILAGEFLELQRAGKDAGAPRASRSGSGVQSGKTLLGEFSPGPLLHSA